MKGRPEKGKTVAQSHTAKQRLVRLWLGSGLGPVPWGPAEASAHLSVLSPGETALPLHVPHPAGLIRTEKGLAGADLRSSKGRRHKENMTGPGSHSW